MKFPIKLSIPFLFLWVAISPPGAIAQSSNITITDIDGRHWLVDPNGDPFFAHGITHVNNQQAGLNYSEFSEACKALGFNAYGYGCPQVLKSDMPYVEGWNHLVPISTYRGKNGVKYVDVFDQKEQARLEAGVKAICERNRNNPNLIGYCWTDLGAWPLENTTGKNWVEFIRSLPEAAPGQRAWQKFLNNWEGNDPKESDQAFLKLIAREYFRVIGEANRKYDPDHLIFGDRFAFNTYDPDVVKEMLPYVDAIAIQPPFQSTYPSEKYNEIYELTGKPMLLCDFAIRFLDEGKDIRNWKPAENSVVAGKDYTQYVKAALETDYIIGIFWCNPVDTPRGFGNPGVKQGFFGDRVTERPGLHQSVKALNEYLASKTPK